MSIEMQPPYSARTTPSLGNMFPLVTLSASSEAFSRRDWTKAGSALGTGQELSICASLSRCVCPASPAQQGPAIRGPRSRPERVANPFAPGKASTCMLARAGSCNVQVGLGGVDTGAVPGSDVCALDAGAYGYPNSAAFVPDTLYDFFGSSSQQSPCATESA